MANIEKIAVRENGLIMVSANIIPDCTRKVTHKVSHSQKKAQKQTLSPELLCGFIRITSRQGRAAREK